MAPKQKASEAGGKSNNNNTSNDRQGTSERGHGHTNGTSASERGGGGNERTSSGAGHGHGHGHGEKTSGANTGGGTKRKAEAPIISVDIADLEINALRRYCRLNKLKPKSKSREDLATVATKHWNSVNAKEIDSVAYFLFAVKHRRKWNNIPTNLINTSKTFRVDQSPIEHFRRTPSLPKRVQLLIQAFRNVTLDNVLKLTMPLP